MEIWANIKKFGPSHCDLPTMIWNVSIVLRVLTVNIDSNYRKGIPKMYYIFTGIIITSYLYVYGISNIWFVLWRCRETGDLVTAMIFFSLGVSSEISLVKLLFMMLYRKKIREIVQSYLACDALVDSKSRMSSRLLTNLRTIKKRAIFFWSIVIGNGVVYVVKPLILPGRHFFEDNQVLLGLEPLFESPNYEIAFTITTAAVICSCYVPTQITAFLIVLVGYSESQLLALSDRLAHLWNDAEEHYKEVVRSRPGSIDDSETTIIHEKNKSDIKNIFVKQNLKEIVEYHTRTINLIKQVEAVFRESIAVEFGLLMVAMIAELLGGLENTYMELPYALIQVAIDCFIGQRLIDANNTFSQALYGCQWENFDVKNMKTVLLMLNNAYKPLTLSAGGITVLNFVCLGAVLKSIFSYYTTLTSILN